MNNIFNHVINLKDLKDRITILHRTPSIPESVLNQTKADIATLIWSLDELVKLHFTPMILSVGDKDVFNDFGELEQSTVDGITTIVRFTPSKFEISMFRKLFIPEGYEGVKMNSIELPPFILCDRYYASCDKNARQRKSIYMEGTILNGHLEEVGKRSIRNQLSTWLKTFFDSKVGSTNSNGEKGEKS